MTDERQPTPSGAMPGGPQKVIIQNYEPRVQRWLKTKDGTKNVMSKLGEPEPLPWVLFGQTWTRTDGYTVIRERDDTVLMVPTDNITRTDNL